MAAKRAAQDTDLAAIPEEVPQCLTIFNTIIQLHYAQLFDSHCGVSSIGRQLFNTTPHLSRSIAWTKDLTRKIVALLDQFLFGHYPSNQYLFRFNIRADLGCCWYDAPFDDRNHLLFHCPRFESIQRKFQCALVDYRTKDVFVWFWASLSGPGRQFLALFFQTANSAMANARVCDDVTY